MTVPPERKVKLRGAKLWRSRTLSSAEVTTRGGLRFTSLARTMVDLAAILDDEWLRAALDSAIRQDGFQLIRICRLLQRCGPGRRGIGRLRALVEEYRRGAEVPDSVLESRALELAKATAHKPLLHHKVRAVRGRTVAEVDFAWPHLRLGIELDGWAYHGSRQAFVTDRARDRALFQLGWSVLRYPVDAVYEGHLFVDELSRIFKRRAGDLGALRGPPRAS